MNDDAPRRVRLGDVLLERGLLSRAQLDQALKDQERSGRKLGRVIIDLGFVSEAQLHATLANHLKVPFVDLRQVVPDAGLLRQLPEALARRHRAVVIGAGGRNLTVGMSDPTDIFAFDEIKRHLKRPIGLALVSETALLEFIDRNYRRTEEIASLAREVRDELAESDVDIDRLSVDEQSADAAVLRMLQTVFHDAVQMNASDIHIEPGESRLRIRQRVDGELTEQAIEGARVAAALVTRLKLMCGLDIAEKRLPQDGRFSMKIKGRSFDVRVSTLPTVYGESVVLRLLDQSSPLVGLERLGMPADMLARFREIANQSAGLVLVTGPTGSGKTTTLYSVLQFLNSVDTKIITVEDPVEYRLDRIVQVQIQQKIGLDFARVLRTVLRQDPDVVLIGEMRDRETAEIGLRAAMTGHMVFSTLHTLNAVSAVSRLVDMGAEPFLVAASLKAVLAQRLLRRVCEECAEDAQPTEPELAWMSREWPDMAPGEAHWRKGRGCAHCSGSGYRGRIAVYEFLALDATSLDAIRRNDLSALHARVPRLPGFMPLAQSGLALARSGATNVAEVMRALSGLETRDAPVASTVRRDAAGEGSAIADRDVASLLRA